MNDVVALSPTRLVLLVLVDAEASITKVLYRAPLPTDHAPPRAGDPPPNVRECSSCRPHLHQSGEKLRD
jgi:hypothetical protein